MARRDAAGVRLLTRKGHDWTSRFPQIAAAATALRCRSCLIDGKAVCCDDVLLTAQVAAVELANDAKPGLQLSVHLDHPRDVVFEHACKLGLEGIVSKRRGSRDDSGLKSVEHGITNRSAAGLLQI